MPPKILLVMPKHREGDKTFPFGIATVYSRLKESGFDVDLVDCVVEGKSFPELITPSRLGGYDVIGIGGLVSCYKRVKEEIVPFIRKHAPRALIAVGGYLGISVPRLLLSRGLCEVCFLGDAEESLPEFLEVSDRKEEWRNIVGLAYLDGGGSYVSTGARRLENLEKTYVPYHKHMEIEKYNAHQKDRNKTYPLVVEVGCLFNCNFCFNSSSNKPRSRSPEHVIEEIKVAAAKYGYPRVGLMSENLLSRPRWVTRFCELIRENGLRFKWEAAGHARTLNDGILSMVKQHGCTEIGIGFENFSQKILDAMNKRVKVEDNIRALKLLRTNGLKFSGTMIFGYLGESRETIEENIRVCREYAYAAPYFWIQAYPLTTLYAQCMEKGLIRDEEEYVERLGDITEYVINMTEFPDAELVRMREMMNDAIRLDRGEVSLYRRVLRHYGLSYLLHFLVRAVRNPGSLRN